MARTANNASQIAKLKKQLAALELKEKSVTSKKKEKALAGILTLIKENGLTIEAVKNALGSGSKAKSGRKAAATSTKKSALKGKTVPPKYRNPNNANETWTGRGVAPKWVQALKADGTLESALIASAQATAPAAQ